MNRNECLQKAINIVTKSREDEYGKPENNFCLISELWSVYLDKHISPQDVSMMMILLKIARIKTGKFKEDSFVDIAGYAACGSEIQGRNDG